MTPEEILERWENAPYEIRAPYEEPEDYSLYKSDLLRLIKEAQHEAVEKALLEIQQELRFIQVPYVSQPERSIYNEALCDACKVADELSVKKILEGE